MADENRSSSRSGKTEASVSDGWDKSTDSLFNGVFAAKKSTAEDIPFGKSGFSGGSAESSAKTDVGFSGGSARSSAKTVTKAPQNVYLDATDDTEEEKAELEKSRKNAISPKDKRIISALAIIDAVIFTVLGIFLYLSGADDPYAGIKKGNNFDPEKDYYDVSDVYDGILTPKMNDVGFPQGLQDRFKSIYSENEDTAGWIKINGTSIDFPVLQTDNNQFYERKNFYGEYDRRGSIWLDARCKLGRGRRGLSKNTILYGHNLTEDECIFRDVTKYRDLEYYKAHPVVEFDTIYNNFKWKVFSCFVTTVNVIYDNGNLFYYIDPYITDDLTEAFASECLTRSYFVNPAVDIIPTDKLLCLSTCLYDYNTPSTYIETRCVLMARLVRENEDETVDVSGAFANENRRMPQIYYDRNGLTNPYVNVPVFKR